jgi:sigma-B regulation protein RsbU (phosphoserine phosphatase)
MEAPTTDDNLFDAPPRQRPKDPFDAMADYSAITAQNTIMLDDGAPSPFPRFSPPSFPTSATEMRWDGTALITATDFMLDGAQKELEALKVEINVLRRRDETLNFYMARLDEELRLAARLQQDFLPKTLPQVGPAHFHVIFRPAGYVSGDLYDVLRLDEKHVAFFLVDAVGHGMPAALLTMFIKRALCCKEVGPGGYRLLPPGETLGRVNDALVEQNLSAATFATALYGVLNTETLELTLATAGHPAPLLLREQTMTEVPVEGALLGVFDHENYTASTVKLRPGDRLLVYSDGVEVAFGEDIAAQKGQWRDELFGRRSLSAEDLVLSFAAQLDREAGSLQPRDDLTLLVLEIR